MEPAKIPYLIFKLGSIDVYTYKTQEEIIAGTEEYTEVYWQDRVSKTSYGPFTSIYDCMTHYTQIVTSQKYPVIGEEWNAPIIYVDFKTKTRIVYNAL